jgi:peptidoglycan/LPS O-acetylase OafA/YrhL
MGVTWYMANDMQFYILSPLFILPLWKNFKIGILWWSAVMVGMTGVIGYFVLHYQLPVTNLVL